MRTQAIGQGRKVDGFTRLHRLFTVHFGHAVGFAWAASLGAACQAPWLRNLRGLMDPLGRTESTASYLFTLPLIMTIAWACLALGGDALRRGQVLKSPEAEFALAGLVAFAVFCLAIHRAVTACLVG